MRRIIYLIIIVAAVGAVIGVGYYFRYQGSPLFGGEITGPGTTGPITLPPLPQQAEEVEVPVKLEAVQGDKPTRVAAGSVFGYFVNSATSSVVVQGDGQVVRLDQDTAEILSATKIESVLRAEFSSDGKKLMVAFGSKSSPQASIFDLEEKSWRPFQEAVHAFAWSPTDSRLAYVAEGSSGSGIRILDTSRANARAQTLLTIQAKDLNLSWQRESRMLISQAPSSKVPGSLLGVNVPGGTITPLIRDRKGLDVVWSGSSGLGLAFESGLGEKGGTLRLVSETGSTLRTMSFITLPEKCTFYSSPEDKEYLICGVPLNYQLWNASTLPDAYLKKEIFARDWFYRVDVASGEIEVIYDGEDFLDARDLRITGGVLYFQNRLDGSLYGLAL